ncbi:Cupredoxin [Gymnopilus junonius]|uniref:laccase n=1 Tax=Gymnopilus junonius TaxID=109634 RepID=A0A9P5NE57_GYMJU|nr:Cupredoxin [Gymnopilus junonius]
MNLPAVYVIGSLLASAIIAAAAIGPSANMVIGNKFISPDGYNRSTVLAGATGNSLQFPGPLVTGKKGDTFNLNVIDHLTNTSMLTSTSIHWHGLFQEKSTWADGPVGVTQCPIAPGHSFFYRFKVPDQAGTFSTQYCDGLRGPLVVYDPSDPHGSLSPKTRYRFRLVSISCDPNFLFSIDGHDMTIIEVDGQNTQPLVVDSIQIFAGQRYSFHFEHQSAEGQLLDPRLSYDTLGAANIEPTTTSSLSNPLIETNLHPLSNLKHLFVNGSFEVNNATFIPPKVPVLLQILSHKYKPKSCFLMGPFYLLEPNKIVEISMPGGSTGSPHPIHLHGHAFSVVRSAGSSTVVVSIGDNKTDLVTIRFKTDNSGPWILHCHIDWHLEAGLAVVMAENVPGIRTSNPPPAWDQLCPTYNALPAQTFN